MTLQKLLIPALIIGPLLGIAGLWFFVAKQPPIAPAQPAPTVSPADGSTAVQTSTLGVPETASAPQQARVPSNANLPSATWYRVVCGGNTRAFEIHAFDSAARHTGPVPIPNPPPTGFLGREEQIPNSSLGEGGGRTYLTLDTDDQYRIELRGKGFGNFTLKIELLDAAFGKIATVDYGGGLLNSTFRASLTLETSTPKTPPELVIDSDGDGKPDAWRNGDLSVQ